MRLTICAVGRLRASPEKGLVEDYLERARRTGRGLGITAVALSEVEDKRGGGSTAEAQLLERALPEKAALVVLDERGTLLDSPKFAAEIARRRDDGQGDLAFVIGGADGLDPGLRARAELRLSFGPMVWPHMLARVMLAEQIYRATTILAGLPYHRS